MIGDLGRKKVTRYGGRVTLSKYLGDLLLFFWSKLGRESIVGLVCAIEAGGGITDVPCPIGGLNVFFVKLMTSYGKWWIFA